MLDIQEYLELIANDRLHEAKLKRFEMIEDFGAPAFQEAWSNHINKFVGVITALTNMETEGAIH